MDAETIKIKISQVPPYDGEYGIADDAFSTREWRWIKQLSAGEISVVNFNAEMLADPDFHIALAVIAMRRAGRINADEVLKVADVLSDAPLDGEHIELVFPEVEEDEVPLASTSEPSEASSSGSLASENTQPQPRETSGNGLRVASDPWEESLAPTGVTRSGTSPT